MSHWESLGIDPCSDPAVIKRAYAALLKKHRPDEDPQGFAHLHAAYKAALAEAAGIRAQSNSEGDGSNRRSQRPILQSQPQDLQPIRQEISVSQERASERSNAPMPPAEVFDELGEGTGGIGEEIEEEFDDHWRYLTNCVDTAMSDLSSAAELSSWSFLEEYDGMYDLHIRPHFSYYLFECWQEFIEPLDELPHKLAPALLYIGEVMHWRDRRDEFEEQYDDERVSMLLDVDEPNEVYKLQWRVPKQHNGPIDPASIYRRGGAAVLDVILLVFGFIAWTDFFPIHGYLLLALLAHAILHASPLQGTPAKVLFGLKVTTQEGRRLNFLHSIWRSLLFFIHLIGFKFTVWLNWFVPGQRLIHDALSGTYVIRR